MTLNIPNEKASFFEHLEATGEDEVRLKIDNKLYSGRRMAWATEWLAKINRGNRITMTSTERETRLIAKSALIVSIVVALATIAQAIVGWLN